MFKTDTKDLAREVARMRGVLMAVGAELEYIQRDGSDVDDIKFDIGRLVALIRDMTGS